MAQLQPAIQFGGRAGNGRSSAPAALCSRAPVAPLWAPPWVMRPLSSVIPAAGPVDPSQAHAALAAAAGTFMRGGDVAPDGFFERRA